MRKAAGRTPTMILRIRGAGDFLRERFRIESMDYPRAAIRLIGTLRWNGLDPWSTSRGTT